MLKDATLQLSHVDFPAMLAALLPFGLRPILSTLFLLVIPCGVFVHGINGGLEQLEGGLWDVSRNLLLLPTTQRILCLEELPFLPIEFVDLNQCLFPSPQSHKGG